MILSRMHDEEFAVIDGHTGKIIGISKSIRGAMDSADRVKPAGAVRVRGAYTSDGSEWGLGCGRLVAVREHGRWQVG
jgi:hypothetical protein